MANDQQNKSDEGRLIIPTAVAIDRDKNSQHAVKWAVENLTLKDNMIILVHVVTTAQPNMYPEDAAPKQSLAPTQSEIHQMFLPYRGFCGRKGVRVKDVIIHDLDVANTLCEYISANFITTIVLGASTRNAISRAFRNPDVPSCVAKSAPDFCSVYVISKGGKSLKIRTATELVTATTNITCDDTFHRQVSRGTGASSCNTLSLNPSWTDSTELYQHTAPWTKQPLTFSSNTPSSRSTISSNELLHMAKWEARHGGKNPVPANSAYTSFEYTPFGSSSASPQDSVQFISDFGHIYIAPDKQVSGSKNPVRNHNLLIRTKDNLFRASSALSDQSEAKSFQSDASFEYLDHPRISHSSISSTTSSVAIEMEDELRRLKLELHQITEKYNAASKEAAVARDKVKKEIDQWNLGEANTLEGANNAQESVLVILERERQKSKAAVVVATKAQRLAELELEKRRRVETNLKRETEEKQRAILEYGVINYRKYTIEEIEDATKYFSSSNKIGEGGYGPVFKAYLDHTPVAVKIVGSNLSQCRKQFHREVEVLSRMRHPHMVILLGACPEYGCLVYEYMENGSLEDRLCRKNNTPTLPWKARFRIAAEIAIALNFLHRTRPEPLVHRDLKPANILLDKNYVSKISDVGLSRMVTSSSSAQCQATAAAGTFCYIDPEYQQTGVLGTKSDVYSLGVVLLQIITARPAMGLTYQVERAIREGKFVEMLDPTVEDWPVEEAMKLAELALKCCELRRRDRPELDSVIVSELERLRELQVAEDIEAEAKFSYFASQAQTLEANAYSSHDSTQDNI